MSMMGLRHSEETKQKISLKLRGKNNPNFRKFGKDSPAFGYRHTDDAKRRMSEKRKNEKHPQWKGDAVGYNAIHTWVVRHVSKPNECSYCRIKNKKLELAYIDHYARREGRKYVRDVSLFVWLCLSCHRIADGRASPLEDRQALRFEYKRWHARMMKEERKKSR